MPPFRREIVELGVPANKTWMLSEQKTALKARDLHSLVAERFLQLLPLARTIQKTRENIEQLEGSSPTMRRSTGQQWVAF